MAKQRDIVSRRGFLGVSAGGAALGFSAVADPAAAAAQAAGVRKSDLPDLTIKEVKTYVLKAEPLAGAPAGFRSPREARLFSVVTNSGIEGNYTLGRTEASGLLESAKGLLVGKNAVYCPAFTSIWDPSRRRHAQSPYAATIDYALWDIVGKAVNLPVYKVLGPYRDKILAYASSQHLSTVEAFVADVKRAKAEGYKGYKIHPPWVPTSSGGAQMGAPTTYVPNQGSLNLQGVDLELDIEVAKAVRQTAGPHMGLILDRVGAYTREQALKMGRVLDQLNYNGFEDALPSVDLEGCVQLCRDIDTPVHMGELFSSMYEFPPYIRERGMDVLRFIGGYIGGITGGMKLAALAECFGLECAPHNWGDTLDHAVHFHCELAMPNDVWFEMTIPQGVYDHPWMKDRIRVSSDGFVHAPAKPGLGYEIDRGVLDNLTQRIER